MRNLKKVMQGSRGIGEILARKFLVKEITLSLRASSPIWASEVSLARTRERGAEERLRRLLARSRALARLASLAQIGELARRLDYVSITLRSWNAATASQGPIPLTEAMHRETMETICYYGMTYSVVYTSS